MSFKLFIASTFGLIKPTEKVESSFETLRADYQMFCDFEKSAELKEYNELELLTNSATFKQQKKEIQLLAFKGSKEAAQLADFRKLERNGRLKRFFATEKSAELKRYQSISKSGLPEKFQSLKQFVTGTDFQQKKKAAGGKKEFESSDAYNKLQEYLKLKVSDDLNFYLRFGKSSGFKNYNLMKDSAERKRFFELQELTNSEAFKNRVAYLEDKQKWEKTEEHQKELRLGELQKLPQLLNYLKYKNSNAFDFFHKWNLVFEDRFESGKLDAEKWITLSHSGKKTLGRNFSQPGDLQAFTEGKNVSLDGKTLKIEVRKESAKGMQWKLPFGFVERDFDYTSGFVSTSEDNLWKHGIWEAKVKYAPQQNIVDALYLVGEDNSTHINLAEMGVKNRLGMLSKSGAEMREDCESISGLKNGAFYIFRLEWTAHSLIWKINNYEILNISQNVPGFKMHLNATSIVVSEPVTNLPHRFEIDWVRVYQPVNA